MRSSVSFLFGLIALALLSFSCNGIFSFIYDDPPVIPTNEYGFMDVDEASHSGTIYVHTAPYDRWTYIDLRNRTIDTSNILMGENEPENWDFALHRYDVKTHNGAACETNYVSLDKASEGGIVVDAYIPDEDDSVMVDLSGMMDGNIVYSPSPVNKILSRWLNVDLSSMPPIYTMSNLVYVLKLQDDTQALLFFANYMNPTGTKGYVTIHYIYPY